jgi:hypothetical protein
MPFDATPIKTNTTADVLRRARALIDSPEKWMRAAGMFDAPYCVMGAVGAAERDMGLDPLLDFGFRARGAIRVVIGTRAIPKWNDAPERTHADVIAAFDRAIALAEAGG